jgi:hypothetical protein
MSLIWSDSVTRLMSVRMCTKFKLGILKGRRYLTEISVDGWIMIMLILNRMQVCGLILSGGKFGLSAWFLWSGQAVMNFWFCARILRTYIFSVLWSYYFEDICIYIWYINMKKYALNMKPFQFRDIRSWFTEYLRSVSINYVTVPWKRRQWHTLNWDFLNQGMQFHDLGYLTNYLDCPLSMTVVRSPPRTIISFFTMASSPDMGIVFSGAEWIKHDADHLSAVTSEIMDVWTFDYVSPLVLIYSHLPPCAKQRRKYSICKVAPLRVQ